MTYRASLGTRGELRRIAAEAETTTIDQVRPWHRNVQPCRLAPHVIVPQWIRSSEPAAPRPAAPALPAAVIAAEIIAGLLDDATRSRRPSFARPGRRAGTRLSTAGGTLTDEADDRSSAAPSPPPAPSPSEGPSHAVGADLARVLHAGNNTSVQPQVPGSEIASGSVDG